MREVTRRDLAAGVGGALLVGMSADAHAGPQAPAPAGEDSKAAAGIICGGLIQGCENTLLIRLPRKFSAMVKVGVLEPGKVEAKIRFDKPKDGFSKVLAATTAHVQVFEGCDGQAILALRLTVDPDQEAKKTIVDKVAKLATIKDPAHTSKPEVADLVMQIAHARNTARAANLELNLNDLIDPDLNDPAEKNLDGCSPYLKQVTQIPVPVYPPLA